jgi:hypothetical protein
MKSKIVSILDIKKNAQLFLPGCFLYATKVEKFSEHFQYDNYVAFHNGFSSPHIGTDRNGGN